MPRTYTRVVVHVVFATKGRQPWLAADVSARVHGYMGGVVREEGGNALEIGGAADHVHLLVRVRMDRSIADLMRVVKARSSKWARGMFPELSEFGWQEGYGAFSVSASQEEAVRAYIRGQEAHHARFDFKEELRRLLVAHRVEFDERWAFEECSAPPGLAGEGEV